MREFRAEGGIVKTDEEKAEMAQKHRFKKEREFKQRITEQEENEADDIRNFTFHKHDISFGKGHERKSHFGDRAKLFGKGRDDDEHNNSGRGGKRSGDKDGKRFNKESRGGKRFGDKKFGKEGKRFGREDKRGFGKRNMFNDDTED